MKMGSCAESSVIGRRRLISKRRQGMDEWRNTMLCLERDWRRERKTEEGRKKGLEED
jgi:hypothetical protein